MSTYQDRAREIVQAAINFAVAEETRKQKTLVDNYPQVSLEGALSELASIVEEEIIGEDDKFGEDYLHSEKSAGYRNSLRQEQRDQLSNRRGDGHTN